MSRARPPSVAYSAALGQEPADKRILILRLLAAGGSISQAGRDAGVSYKAAWQAIDTLTNLAGVALVERAVGGAGGGGARLTPAGLQLLVAADALHAARTQVLERLQRAGGAGGNGGIVPALGRLSLRTSMRNQLPCAVRALDGPGPIVQVRLALGDGTGLTSRITRESAELLGLGPGLQVLALCKATGVIVSRAADGGSARGVDTRFNLLPGRVTRIARGHGADSVDEIAAELCAGLRLVGFAPPRSGLRVGSRVVLAVDEAAVVLALPD